MEHPGPAAKRLKLSNESSSTTVHVKKEERESSTPPPQRRVVTSGSIRYATMPENCQKTFPGHKKNRQAWSKVEIDILRASGIRAVRTFVR